MNSKTFTHNKVNTVVVDASSDQQRIDNFLVKKLKNIPKSRIYSMLRKGEVRVNGGRVKAAYKLQVGDKVRVPPYFGESARDNSLGTVLRQPTARSIKMLRDRIIYEDADLLAINKPAGVAAHGGSGINFGVIEILRAAFPKLKELELVHRLDRDTSGLMLISKKRSALRTLHELIRQGKIHKCYQVLVKGRWNKGNHVEKAPLVKNQLAGGERIVKVSEAGKSSKTLFKPVKIFTIASLLDVELFTGRMHQIRVHAKHLGYPIAGDEKYGDKDFNKTMNAFGLNRLFLHAKSLHFTFPNGESFVIECAIDDDLKKVISSIDL